MTEHIRLLKHKALRLARASSPQDFWLQITTRLKITTTIAALQKEPQKEAAACSPPEDAFRRL